MTQPRRGLDKVDLTPAQSVALDATLDNTTDAEIEASIRWLDEVEDDVAQEDRHE